MSHVRATNGNVENRRYLALDERNVFHRPGCACKLPRLPLYCEGNGTLEAFHDRDSAERCASDFEGRTGYACAVVIEVRT